MFGVGKSDVGKVRQINEDFIFISNESVGILPNLYIVADGMGGHNAGDVASKSAISYFCEYIINNQGQNQGSEILDLLVGAVKYANKNVFEMSKQNILYSGMGTTFLAASLKGDSLYIAHIGDCRLYLIREQNIMQITTDHTYVMDLVRAGEITFNEVKNHPKRNIITRALGIDGDLLVDGLITKANLNDIFILCSDGLTSMLDDSDILQIILKNTDIFARLDKLVSYANERGGADNISVVLIQK